MFQSWENNSQNYKWWHGHTVYIAESTKTALHTYIYPTIGCFYKVNLRNVLIENHNLNVEIQPTVDQMWVYFYVINFSFSLAYLFHFFYGSLMGHPTTSLIIYEHSWKLLIFLSSDISCHHSSSEGIIQFNDTLHHT